MVCQSVRSTAASTSLVLIFFSVCVSAKIATAAIAMPSRTPRPFIRAVASSGFGNALAFRANIHSGNERVVAATDSGAVSPPLTRRCDSGFTRYFRDDISSHFHRRNQGIWPSHAVHSPCVRQPRKEAAIRGIMNAESDHDLPPNKWETLKALRLPAAKNRLLNRFIVDQLIAL